MDNSQQGGPSLPPSSPPQPLAAEERPPVDAAVARQISLQQYAWTLRLWHLALLTLPLDLLLLLLPALPFALPELAQEIERGLYLLLLGAGLGLFRQQILGLFFEQAWRELAFAKYLKQAALLVIFGLVLFAALGNFSLLLEMSRAYVGPILAVALTIYSVYKSALNSLEDLSKEAGGAPDGGKIIVYTSLSSALLARLVSPVAFLYLYLTGASLLTFPLYVIAALLLMLELRPKVEEFLAVCRRCAHWSARSLLRGSLCPGCRSLSKEHT